MANYKNIILVLVVQNMKNVCPKILSSEAFLFADAAEEAYAKMIAYYKGEKNTVVLKKTIPINETVVRR